MEQTPFDSHCSRKDVIFNFPIKPAIYSLTLREIHKKNKQCSFNFVWNLKCDKM